MTGEWQEIDVANMSLTVPANWTVVNRDDDFIQVRDPATKSLEIAESGTFRQATTVGQFQQGLIDAAKEDYTEFTITTPAEEWRNGPRGGLFFALTATDTSQAGSAFTVYDIYYIAVDETDYFMWRFIVSKARWDEFKPTYDTLPPPTWKLYSVGD